MLHTLSIRNYALIQELRLSPAETLSIITGETGAGKSILLGALGLLMGKRADSRVLFDTTTKCIIEGTFQIGDYRLNGFFEQEGLDYDPETIIRREINTSGKSRAFVNDTPVTLETLKKLSAYLMDIHSQHETLQLANTDFQVQLLDAFGGTLDKAAEYRKEYRSFIKRTRERDEMLDKQRALEKESDYKNFVLQELVDANLEADELNALEKSNAQAEHAEEIKGSLAQIEQVLQESEYSTLSSLQEAIQHLRNVKDFSDELSEAFERLESVSIELADIAQTLLQQNEHVDFDPREAERIAERLSHLYHLQQKHHVVDIEGLIALRDSLAEEVISENNLADTIDLLNKALLKEEKALMAKAGQLFKVRSSVTKDLSSEMERLLKKIGIPEAQLSIEAQETESLSANGKNSIEILFSANRGFAPQPIAKTASGGEFSRVMFAVKHILADKIALPTIIFDEIDTGVSGEVALKMGDMMKFMAQNHQVIAISHLPQIAARADQHYLVFKEVRSDSTVSSIKLLSDKERITHIAQMIGGETPTDTAMQNARELINHG